MTVRLVDGPRAGWTEQVPPPLPDLVAVAYCVRCMREHLHGVRGAGDTGGHPLYLRDPRHDREGVLAYRWVDVDDVLDRALEHDDTAQLLDRFRHH